MTIKDQLHTQGASPCTTTVDIQHAQGFNSWPLT